MPVQPYDEYQKDKRCVVCRKELTSRVIDGKAVCTTCFTKGWGRLPAMPIPDSEFVCDECGKECISQMALTMHKQTHKKEVPHERKPQRARGKAHS